MPALPLPLAEAPPDVRASCADSCRIDSQGGGGVGRVSGAAVMTVSEAAVTSVVVTASSRQV